MSNRNKILAHCMTNIYQWVSGQQKAVNQNSHLISLKPVILRDLGEISEILPDQLYLSGSAPLTAEKLFQMGFTGIVCALTETEEERVLPASYFTVALRAVYVRLADSEGSDMSVYFDPVTEFIQDEIERGGKVLVHCVAGISRSATLVMAYLMRYKNMNTIGAFNYVIERRKIVQPNDSFLCQLNEYENMLKREKGNDNGPEKEDLLKIEDEHVRLAFVQEKHVAADV